MTKKLAAFVVLVPLIALLGCRQQQRAQVLAFQPDPPRVYVAKVKNLLVGLPPTQAEVDAVTADPNALGGLVDQWMAQPEYQQKMLQFFELAFQQTQLTPADFFNVIPARGLGDGPLAPLLIENVRESFARTVLQLIAEGRPLTDAFTTHRLMMTPALMELYAFLDARRVDAKATVIDPFAAAHPTLQITLETADGPIAAADTLDASGPKYLHWYNRDVATLKYGDASCKVDPVVLPLHSYSIHLLLYGQVEQHTSSTGASCERKSTRAASAPLGASDFTTWKMVTLRAPAAGEATTLFYDLDTLRSAGELVLQTPHVGFVSTPAFAANWPTNRSNQMRVTANQALIVATGAAVDGTDPTHPATTPGLDSAHAASAPICMSCHQQLDPTRSILSSTYNWFYYPQTDAALEAQPGLFAFQGVIAPMKTLDDFGATLASHPLVPEAWAQKLCYYVSSAACPTDDPEFQRVLTAFSASHLSWNVLVRELVASPLTTHARQTTPLEPIAPVVTVARRDHLCAALDHRLGLDDVCNLSQLSTSSSAGTNMAQIVTGLPSDGYGRGSTAPLLPTAPSLFYRAGLENVCGLVASLVIDAAPDAAHPHTRVWSSAQPDAAIADFVSVVMALTPSDPRAAGATTILKRHFTQAVGSGASATDALKSTFVAACLAPSASAVGM